MEHKGTGGIRDSILFFTSLPIDTTALKGIEIFNANDTILQPLQWEKVELLPGRTLVGMLKAKLNYNTSYEIYFDSLIFRDVYGNTLGKTVVDAFKTKPKGEFSHLHIMIHGVEPPFIGELLSKDDKVLRTVYSDGTKISFRDLLPDTYAFRLVLDRNGNGKWDPGDYSEMRQPEEVYYLPKLLELMKNWELSENFYPLETPLAEQKPTELIRNKPKERKRRNLNAEREKEMK